MALDDPDGDLVRRIGAGERAAIGTLLDRKLARMSALAQRLLGDPAEAEDVVQELFLRVWRHAAAWQPGVARFDTWMHQVALNLCRDRLRKRRIDPLPDGWDAADPAIDAEGSLLMAERGRRIAVALDALPTRQREAIVLTYYQELSNADAATMMGVGAEALESLLARGRRNLRALMTDANDG